jgi:L-asparagine transporter-like permease
VLHACAPAVKGMTKLRPIHSRTPPCKPHHLSGHLERQLKNRHIQLIALGGTIGTGLFLGSAGILALAGPSMLLGYAIGGGVAFLLMRFLGEMLVEEPIAGSFSHFANRYGSHFAGFLSGWNCVALYVLVGMVELTAAGRFVQYWWPGIPVWVTAAVCFVAINAVNFIHVKAYGEFEFWFALIKVVAVLAMIVTGIWLVAAGGRPDQTVRNLWGARRLLPARPRRSRDGAWRSSCSRSAASRCSASRRPRPTIRAR